MSSSPLSPSRLGLLQTHKGWEQTDSFQKHLHLMEWRTYIICLFILDYRREMLLKRHNTTANDDLVERHIIELTPL